MAGQEWNSVSSLPSWRGFLILIVAIIRDDSVSSLCFTNYISAEEILGKNMSLGSWFQEKKIIRTPRCLPELKGRNAADGGQEHLGSRSPKYQHCPLLLIYLNLLSVPLSEDLLLSMSDFIFSEGITYFSKKGQMIDTGILLNWYSIY